jgi:hypothetical protein
VAVKTAQAVLLALTQVQVAAAVLKYHLLVVPAVQEL